MKKFTASELCYMGLFTAIIVVLSWVSIPMPWGVPITLQTFAVALCGYAFDKWRSSLCVAVYILLGLVGVPVFSGMNGGAGVLFGPTGGYIFGFLLMAFFCGLAQEIRISSSKGRTFNVVIKILIGVFGLLCCHALGIVVLKNVSGMDWGKTILVGTLPYLIKDVASIAAAYFAAIAVRRVMRLKRA